MKPEYDTILLDADDTLFDFGKSERQALTSALAQFGYTCSEEIYRTYSAINLSLWKLHERGKIEKQTLRTVRFEQLKCLYGFSFETAAFNEAYSDALADGHFLFPGAFDFLSRAKRLCRLYLITNGITQVQQKRLHDSAIESFFADVFISEKIGYAKPDIRFFEHVERAVPHFDRKKALVFGDSLSSDIAGAVRAGIASCWYNPRGLENTSEVKPTYTAESYSDFLMIIGDHTCI